MRRTESFATDVMRFREKRNTLVTCCSPACNRLSMKVMLAMMKNKKKVGICIMRRSTKKTITKEMKRKTQAWDQQYHLLQARNPMRNLCLNEI